LEILNEKKIKKITEDKNINIGSVSISSGDWIYVDTNGWVVSRKKLEL
jgi:regulator of RNase E activity RraA